MRAHLATCSVLRSSAYRKYASSLRTCARVDLQPSSRDPPPPGQKLGLPPRFAGGGNILAPPPHPQWLSAIGPPSATTLELVRAKRCIHLTTYSGGEYWGGEAGLRILCMTPSEARRQ